MKWTKTDGNMKSESRIAVCSMGVRALAAAGLVSGSLCGCTPVREPVEAGLRLHETARPRPEIPGAPAKSDVCMRSLFPRPRDANDPHDTLEAIRRFHVTWLEWTYGDDAEFIRKVKDLGAVYGGALAAGVYMGDVPHEEWNVRDLEGNPVYATWMRAWVRPNPWGCANHPEFREGHVRAALRAVEAGADLLQRDEPGQNRNALSWGGCFCEYCMKGFNEWLARHADPEILAGLGVRDLGAFDYREYLRERNAPVGDAFNPWPGDALKAWFVRFQTESTVEFNRWWREELNRRAGRRIPVSCNNGVHIWDEIRQVFDYCIGELNASNARPDVLYSAMRSAHAVGLTQSMTMPLHRHDNVTPEWIRLIRQTLATVYAVGAHMEMPWDTYLPTPDARRFFGDPADYADLTAFVRGMAGFLDGYADAFAAGFGIDDPRWPPLARPVSIIGGQGRVYAFARARPGEPEAPVAVHLVDWRAEPAAFGLSVDPAAFFGDRPLRFRLFTPVRPYEREAHDRAFETGDYSGLVRETELARGRVATLEIPALAPWGILVVEPDAEAADREAPWPPSILSGDERFYEEARIVLGCATPGAVIRYTLDGTEPGEGSPVYEGPVTVRESVTVRARSVARGRVSEVVEARFEQRVRPPNLVDNGEFDRGLEGWRRVIFDPETIEDDALEAAIDTGGRLSGPNSVRLLVRKPTGVVFHLRLTHPFRAEAGRRYELTFEAVADGPVECRVGLQGAGPPHRVTGMSMMHFDETPGTYRLVGENPTGDHDALVQFDLGALSNEGRTLWIDNVRLELIEE